MFILTGFGDEISPDLDEQLRVLGSEGIRHLEFRGAWDKNITKLDDTELAKARDLLKKHGAHVSAIGSPIGKVKINEDFEAHFKLFEHCLDLADYFETPFIRLFSYYPSDGKKIADDRDEVMRRMKRKADAAAKRGKVLLHENEHAIYGESADHCLDLHKSVPSLHLRATFDFANFVIDGEDPKRAFQLLRPYIAYIHIKDAKRDKQIVPAGEGDGHIAEILAELDKDNRDYFLSLEPHLSFAGSMYGRSGPELFIHAIRSLKIILDGIGAKWR